MWLLAGLGNPGAQYAGTRHNAGFMVMEALQTALSLPPFSKKHKGLVSKGRGAGRDLVLLMPHTFMNLSGESVGDAARFYKVAPARVLVIHDELDLPLAHLKYKVGGGDAGHNGLRSITAALGTPDYARLRFGIGRPIHKSQVTDYVLRPFDPPEALLVAERVAWIAGNLPGLLDHPHAALAKLKPAA